MTSTMNRAARLAGLCCLAVLSGLWTGSAGAWDWGGVKGSGNVVKVSRAVSGFNAVSLDLPAKVELVQGDGEGVVIETDDNIAPLIETVVERGQLKLRFKERNTSVQVRTMNITVNLRNLEELAIGGSGDMRAASLRTPKLRCAIAGSGNMQLQALDTESLALSIAGSGDFSAGGRARSMQAKVAGSGNVRTEKLAADQVKLSIAGSGDARVWARETLGVSVAGSGDVAYYGDAVVSKSVAGSGSVKRLGAAP